MANVEFREKEVHAKQSARANTDYRKKGKQTYLLNGMQGLMQIIGKMRGK